MTRPNLEQAAFNAYQTLRQGKLVLVPTDVGYGLVAMEEEAVELLYELKGRPLSKPCVTVANARIFDDLVIPIAKSTRAWLAEISERTPITIITPLDPRSRLLASMSPYVREQATQKGSIATFHSAGPIVERIAELAYADGRVVMGSSANLAGTGNNYSFESVPETMKRAAGFTLDCGPAWYANDEKLASTILDLRTGTFQRKGVNYTFIERSWSWENRSPLLQAS